MSENQEKDRERKRKGDAPTFDQRNQVVGTQYNVAGDLNIGAVSSRQEFLAQLELLASEFTRAAEAKVIDKATAIEAKANVEIAATSAAEAEPSKETILERLTKAKDIVLAATGGVAAATGLIEVVNAAIKVVPKLF